MSSFLPSGLKSWRWLRCVLGEEDNTILLLLSEHGQTHTGALWHRKITIIICRSHLLVLLMSIFSSNSSHHHFYILILSHNYQERLTPDNRQSKVIFVFLESQTQTFFLYSDNLRGSILMTCPRWKIFPEKIIEDIDKDWDWAVVVSGVLNFAFHSSDTRRS